MDQNVKCKSLSAVFIGDKFLLGGPHIVDFNTKGNQKFHIRIEQCGYREITITSNQDVLVKDIYRQLTNVEKILMLLDGWFVPLSKLQLSNSDTSDENQLISYQNDIIKRRLACYYSADFCKCAYNNLMEFDNVLNAELYFKWEKLLKELDIVHQMYLYSVSDTKITKDIIVSFLIELAEPLIEVIIEHKKFFASLDPESHSTTLKNCLDALITKYGEDIFRSEIEYAYDEFLTALVKNRVRIMHIKRKQKGVIFNGNESYLYIMKMNLLYRRILFEVLDIEEKQYKENLIKCVSILDNHCGILREFLPKLKK